MKEINIYEAKTNLSKIINDVLEREEIIIGRAGLPLVKIIPIENKKKTEYPAYSKKI